MAHITYHTPESPDREDFAFLLHLFRCEAFDHLYGQDLGVEPKTYLRFSERTEIAQQITKALSRGDDQGLPESVTLYAICLTLSQETQESQASLDVSRPNLSNCEPSREARHQFYRELGYHGFCRREPAAERRAREHKAEMARWWN